MIFEGPLALTRDVSNVVVGDELEAGAPRSCRTPLGLGPLRVEEERGNRPAVLAGAHVPIPGALAGAQTAESEPTVSDSHLSWGLRRTQGMQTLPVQGPHSVSTDMLPGDRSRCGILHEIC